MPWMFSKPDSILNQAANTTAEERETLTTLLAREKAEHPAHNKASLLDALSSPHTWILSFIYGLVVFGFYLVNIFTPTIFKEALTSSGFITASRAARPGLQMGPGGRPSWV